MKEMTTEQIGKAIKALLPGKSFTVTTTGERRMALMAAKLTGKRITTRRRKDSAGFLVFAIE